MNVGQSLHVSITLFLSLPLSVCPRLSMPLSACLVVLSIYLSVCLSILVNKKGNQSRLRGLRLSLDVFLCFCFALFAAKRQTEAS